MSGTVVVACKIPNGVRLSGDVVVLGPAQVDEVPAKPGGFALTEGVPSDAWEVWLARNAQSTIVERQMIFAGADPVEVRSRARRLSRIKTGLEPTRVA